jgi:hypothetical protein
MEAQKWHFAAGEGKYSCFWTDEMGEGGVEEEEEPRTGRIAFLL